MRTKSVLLLAAASMVASTVAPQNAAAKKAIFPAAPVAFTDKEKQAGAKAHTEIMAEFGDAYNGPSAPYVVRVGKKIAAQSGLASGTDEYTVSYLNSPVNNAFAIEGGYIYITRQLVGLCNSEAEMAGVLGHEIGHTYGRHSKKRQKKATLYNILGTVGTIGGAIFGGGGGIGGMVAGLARDYSGTLAQLFTLKYSRGQEEEADDYGIFFLSKAGYDPNALSQMLTSLALQTDVDSRAAGHAGGPIPEWASTHPDPAKRVVRAATTAKKYAAGGVLNRDEHLAQINNMLYDDDPKEGVIDGQEFLHPSLQLKFSVPAGFGLANGAQAVSINGNGGQAVFAPGKYSGDKKAYLDAAFKQVVGDQQQVSYDTIKETTVNGIAAFSATANVQGKSGQIALTVFAYDFGGGQAYHFVTVAPAGSETFTGMYQSFARMTKAEADAVKPRKLQIVTVGKNDTVATLASRMAYKSLQSDRFLALNGLAGNATVTAGQRVKIVTY